MISASENPDLIFGNLINEPMFLIYSARPATFEFMFEGLWFANPLDWIVHYFLYQINYA